MRKYARYKDSGISWIGDVPEHWDVLRAKYMFNKEKRDVRDGDDVITCFRDGEVTLRKNRRTSGFTESITEIGYQGIRKNDLVIHQMDAFAGAIGVSDSDGKGTSVYHCCTPLGNYDVRYYAHLLREMAKKGYIQSLYRGIRERSSDFNFQVFGKQYLVVPPLPEQKAIAEYLDKKTAQINELVSAKQKQIELLKEYKQSVIANAVTGKMNKNRRMKDSGISWIGKIPENWEKLPFCALFEQKSQCGYCDEELLSVYLDKGVIRFSDGGEKRANATSEDLSKYQLVDVGDFVLNNQQAWRGSVGVSFFRGIVSPAYVILKMSEKLDRNFANYLLRDRSMVAMYCVCSKGVGSIQRNLVWNKLKRMPVFIPPLSEQKEIVAYIEKKVSSIDSQIASIEKQIVNLNEYKQSLISDVVTGKVKVC